MKSEVSVNWLEDMSFETEINGHRLVIDASEEFGGKNKGPRPKPLVLLALAGCTAMDVISLFKKFRMDVKDLKITVEGDMSEEHPKQYTKMNVIYNITGNNIDIKKAEKAVKLSMESYCGVSAQYKKGIDISYEIKIIPA
jgi:putative redox protein